MKFLVSVFVLMLFCNTLFAEPLLTNRHTIVNLEADVNNVVPAYPLGYPANFDGQLPLNPEQPNGYQVYVKEFKTIAKDTPQGTTNASAFWVSVLSTSKLLSTIDGYAYAVTSTNTVGASGSVSNYLSFTDTETTKVGVYEIDIEMEKPINGATYSFKLVGQLDSYNYLSAWYDPTLNKMKVLGKQRINGVVYNINTAVGTSSQQPDLFKFKLKFNKQLSPNQIGVITTKVVPLQTTGDNLFDAAACVFHKDFKISLRFTGYKN